APFRLAAPPRRVRQALPELQGQMRLRRHRTERRNPLRRLLPMPGLRRHLPRRQTLRPDPALRKEGDGPYPQGRHARRSRRLSSDQKRASSQPARTRKTSSRPRKSIGAAIIAHSPPSTMPSSPNEASQLENGSGEVLIASRLPALAKWVPA